MPGSPFYYDGVIGGKSLGVCVKGGCVGAWWAGLPKVRGMGMRTIVYCTGRYRGYKTADPGYYGVGAGGRGVLCRHASFPPNKRSEELSTVTWTLRTVYSISCPVGAGWGVPSC